MALSALWTRLARFFNSLARKSHKPTPNKGRGSARQEAFYHFWMGKRPHELPDLGVTKETKYRYFQSWKRRFDDMGFRVLKKLLLTEQQPRQDMAAALGVSEAQLAHALKGCRNKTQLRRRLGITQAEELFELLEAVEEADHQRLLTKVRACRTAGERTQVLMDEAKRRGFTLAEFNLILRDRLRRFGR